MINLNNKTISNKQLAIEVLDKMVENYSISKENNTYKFKQYVDYSDEMSKDYFLMNECEKDGVFTDVIDNSDYYIYQYLREEMVKAINNMIPEDTIANNDIDDLIYEIEDHIEIDYGMYDLIGNTNLKVNILLNHNDEWNYDYTGNKQLLEIMTDEGTDYTESEIEDLFNNTSIGLLIQEQGYALEEALDQNFTRENEFFVSLYNEYNNMFGNMSQLAIMLDMSGEDFIDDIKEGSQITIDKNSMIGLFDKWQGGGSILDIQLEKDFTFTIDEHTEIQIEGARNNNNYTINEVYGLVGECWNNKFKVSKEINRSN